MRISINVRILCWLLALLSMQFTESSAQGQKVALLDHWTDSTLVATIAHGNVFNDVWGFEQDGRRYAVIGSTAGAHFFDITDPANIIEVDFVAGRASGTSLVHRDYHDYNGYLYMVADEGNSSLQIADLSYLPDSVHLVYDNDSLVQRCHNVFIDTAKARLYLCANSTSSKGFFGLEILDISNPINPFLLDSYQQSVYGVVHDAYVRNDTAFLNSAHRGIYVVDFSNLPNDSVLATLTTYPDQGYNHSGWLSEDGKYYVFADETHGKAMKILDVSDLTNINVLCTFGTDVQLGSIPHNIMVFDDKIYVSYYYHGFRMYDMSTPTLPTEIGSYSTSKVPLSNQYKGAWGIYTFQDGIVLISDMQEGLFVLSAGEALSSRIPEKGLDAFSVYPNPSTNGVYNIRPTKLNKQTIFSYEVFNLQGQSLVSKKFQNNGQIDLSGNPSGVYMLKILSEKGIQTSRIVKE